MFYVIYATLNFMVSLSPSFELVYVKRRETKSAKNKERKREGERERENIEEICWHGN